MKTGYVEYKTIIPYWDVLWPDQDHRQHSAMLMRGGHDSDIHTKYKWRGWAVKERGQIIGVMAGHKSSSREYRTRGLWVKDGHRGRGVARQLFQAAEAQAKMECCRWLWSYPRLQALGAYQKAGYEPFGPTERGLWDDCIRAKKDLSVVTTTVWNLTDNPLENLDWTTEVDSFDQQNFLLGQNEEVRDKFIHVTQHWVNEDYCYPLAGIGDISPITEKRGDLEDPLHVL